MNNNQTARMSLLLGLLSFVFAAAFFILPSYAQVEEPATNLRESVLHPSFSILDATGHNVLETNNPLSTIETCGQCHDSEFIAQHSVHSDAGLSLIGQNTEISRAWEAGIGWFGNWSPIVYRYLSNEDDSIVDLTRAEWLQTYGIRYVGGIVSEIGRNGSLLTAQSSNSLDAQIFDPDTNELLSWDWEESGNLEMNCFLCHLENPSNAARLSAIEAGQFAWASTATLSNTGVVTAVGDIYTWNQSAFNAEGQVQAEFLHLGAPSNENCGQCHGLVDSDARTALVFDPFDASHWNTLTTGQLYSPQRISNSGMNIENKSDLSQSWDIHAERAVNCIDCHYSLNNPIFFVESEDSRPQHLEFDPRRMGFDEYLNRPLHQFANGGYAYVDTFTEFERANRSCASCHDAISTHTWLAYPERHMDALACETCHVARLYAPTIEEIDWTVLDSNGDALMTYRGIDTSTDPVLLTSYQPVLLPQEQADGTIKIAPYNLVAASYWVYGEPARPVPLRLLEAVWFTTEGYAEEILAIFDSNSDGLLDTQELRIDSSDKEALITERLVAEGLENPRIFNEVQAYAIHHNVAAGDNAISECSTCHSEASRLGQSLRIGTTPFSGNEPLFISGGRAVLNGTIEQGDTALYYQPDFAAAPQNLYLLGKSSVTWVDWLGIALFFATFFGVLVHGALRYFLLRRLPAPNQPEIREVYMYSIYERQWHWLQTAAIFGLIFTGLVIHKPEMFGMFSFSGVVFVHNGLALILVVNAALSAFYHLVSGEIRQFLPRPYGFFDKMFEQTKFYLYGIFKGSPHPFEKTPQDKLNPIQQLTYFGLLNVLLPLQVITGALMWGAQHWTDWTNALGGLPFLAPFHSLIAWLLSSFIVLHVYMTTTGHAPLSNIKAMILGWDEVEVHTTAEAQVGD